MPSSLKPFRRYLGFFVAVAGVAAVTGGLIALRGDVNSMTVALIELLVVVVVATLFEIPAAMLASVLAAFSLNFFFLPPYNTLSIASPENWVALFVFLAVAVTVGQLSVRSHKRAVEAERLYNELQEAFERVSEAEAFKRSEKLKSALLDAVTHDLRTPLTSIKASVTMLIEESLRDPEGTALDPQAHSELLEVINEETDRLNSFVESMVELARLQAGELLTRRASVTAEEIVLKAARRSKQLRKTHNLRSQIEPSLPSVSVDPRAIVEAVQNLLDNAGKYSPAGTAILIAASRSGDKIRFMVEDEGPGIPESEREAVFERFYRGGDGSARGLGMGLAIARGIIEAHGGEIWIESGKKGARFVFDLPVNANGR
jgi:two-component system sensor histidine kinase KdpD